MLNLFAFHFQKASNSISKHVLATPTSAIHHNNVAKVKVLLVPVKKEKINIQVVVAKQTSQQGSERTSFSIVNKTPKHYHRLFSINFHVLKQQPQFVIVVPCYCGGNRRATTTYDNDHPLATNCMGKSSKVC